MRTLVLVDHDNQNLGLQTLNTITCAKALGTVDVLVAGENCQDVVNACAQIADVQSVLVADGPGLKQGLAEAVAPVLKSLAENYDALLAPATSLGKNIMPRVAAMLDVQQLSDILAVVNENTFKRAVFAGNAIQTVQSSDPIKVITVRSTAFFTAPMTGGHADVKAVPFMAPPELSKFISTERTVSSRPDLSSSTVVISGGRGVGSKENFALLEKVADHLGAAIGASRAAVDAGFAPNDLQVGQTGKMVAPELYIAVGISGAIQHLAGMKDSRVIVAINSDPDAPIFTIADYGLVADLFEVLPELAAALEE
ncbi:MAG: FAD-binding protein [Magnetovibrio sp.]|nr:FAD-binding protein [Magnetovibrio sp.]